MPAGTHGEAPVATVDVRELNTLMWAPARAMCPSFAKEIEQARYLKQAPAHERGKAVRIEPHSRCRWATLDPQVRCRLREREPPGGLMQLGDRVCDLLRQDAFPHPARDIRLIETHISWVILAGDFAYKLRKPVNFGFLDFSTLEQRRADCRAEVVPEWTAVPRPVRGRRGCRQARRWPPPDGRTRHTSRAGRKNASLARIWHVAESVGSRRG